MNSLQVMKQTLAYLEGGHFTYETKIADDLRSAIQQEALNLKAENAREIGLNYEPVPVKTYSGGKAWPVQQDQVCPQKICWTPYDCENGRCTGSEKNEPIGRFNGKFRAGDGKMFFEVEVSDEKSLPAVFALIYTTPPKG